MKIWWRGREDTWGNSKGYNVHNGEMLSACERNGLVTTEDPGSCDVAFQIAIPTSFVPVLGKPNVLFTMYEMDSIPASWIPMLQMADLLVVPCRHNATLFRRYYDGPIEVCQEGVDPGVFKPRRREFPKNDRFTFLWLGASNPRKGYEIVMMAAQLWTLNQPADVLNKTQLVLKTQRSNEEGGTDAVLVKPAGTTEKDPRRFIIIRDTRKVDTQELLDLYYGSHAFMLPSFGEGWGLTLCEAQATGLPCIYTPWSGPQDFMQRRFSYPARYKLTETKAVIPDGNGGTIVDHAGSAAMADPNHVYERMVEIFENYQTASLRGLQGAAHIHNRFTWDIAGKRLNEIFKKHYGGKA